MTQALRAEAEAIFHELVGQPDERQSQLLEARCGSRHDLREEVQRLLLATDDRMGSFMRAAPTVSVAALPRVGRYRIESLIGEGGMGLVYAARQDRPERVVALKVLRPGLMSAASLRRFHHEVQALAALQHPGIAQIYDAGAAEMMLGGERFDQPYFAMELIDGEPLTHYARNRQLDTRARLRLFAEVCDAVQHAHQRGVIHRDLKPGNILADAAGCPKVLDFGVARAVNRTADATMETMPGQLIGTLAYMSPEQVAGDAHQADTRSDVYSLGAILFELLSGELPHSIAEMSFSDAVTAIREQAPRRLSAVCPELRGDLETICSKALEKLPERRYSSAAEFAADIRRFLRDEPILARPASRAYHFRKFVARHRVPVLLTTALFLTVGGLAVTSTVQAARLVSRQARLVEAERRATARFDQVRHLAGKFLFDFHDQIVRLPGSIPARQMLVSTALEYLDGLAADAMNDEGLLFELARAYQRVGMVQHSRRAAHLGDFEGARESQQRSIQILHGLLGRRPDHPVFLEHLALAHQSIGETEPDTDRLSDYEKATEIFEALVSRFPHELRYRKLLCGAYLRKGLSLCKTQSYSPGVAEDMTRAKELLDGYAADDPRTARQDLCLWHEVMGDLHGNPFVKHEWSSLEQALHHMETALELHRELVAEAPAHARVASFVMFRQAKIARVLQQLGRDAEAVALSQQAADAMRALSQNDPLDAGLRLNLVSVLHWQGAAHAKAGRLDDALADYAEAIRIQRDRVRNEQGGEKLQLVLGTMLQQMSALHEQRRDWPAVIASATEAMDVWETDWVLRNVNAAMHGKVVEALVTRIDNAHLALGVPDASLKIWQRAVALFERQLGLADGVPAPEGVQANLDRARRGLEAARATVISLP